MTDVLKENPWYYGRLPEYMWLGLILDHYGREKGLKKCYYLIKKLNSLASELDSPAFSNVLNLDKSIQGTFFKYASSIIDREVLSPLTIIFSYSSYPCFVTHFHLEKSDVKERLHKIEEIMKLTSDHQSFLSTDIRFIVLYFKLFTGNISIPRETADLILEYPLKTHESPEMRLIRPIIRSMEIVISDLHNEQYLKIFWEGVSRMSECETFYVEFSEDQVDSDEYLSKVKKILEYYTDMFVSTRPLDDKMLVLLGITTYSYKNLCELVEHNLQNTISGRNIVRVIIEDYIMMKYLLNNESANKNIWSEYQYYGIGQYKLIVERFNESAKSANDHTFSHVAYQYLDALVNEYKNKEFIDMDTTYFGKQNVREKAKSVHEQELFGLYYDYDSAFAHGLWGAIRESVLLKCNSPAHHYHCVPDIENVQKLKSVWHDCRNIMNKTLTVLEDVYGLPSHMRISV